MDLPPDLVRITRSEIDDKTWLFFFLLNPLEPVPQPRADHVSRMPTTHDYLQAGFPVSVVRSVQVSDTPFSLANAVSMMLSNTTVFVFSLPKPPAIAHFSGQPFLTLSIFFLVLCLEHFNPCLTTHSQFSIRRALFLVSPQAVVRPVLCVKMRRLNNNQLEAVPELLQGFHTSLFYLNYSEPVPGCLG